MKLPDLSRVASAQRDGSYHIDAWRTTQLPHATLENTQLLRNTATGERKAYGGGISIGHPPGATGVRMTITAMHHLAETGGRYAIVSMCLGAGQGMAALVENLNR